ncbi:VRR-NUC domain-containing protein [Photobacterium lipolyticum]|uniref:VRR-NUC domain-containing protein n=1 Tax=Photobacterium lipolyticum TaxID=266810 RepID=A0A2T3MZR5_9GAMM|nr:VRR-NUC domain-containing protein [Photobacterium lipolyticum]PSW05464.1 VRR-NUC domain-containing protein [Photobacterium lipolyticum]
MFNQYEFQKQIGSSAKLLTGRDGKVKKQKREPESAEQKAVVLWANKTEINGLIVGDYLTHVANEGKRGPKASKDFIELGGSPGYPDLILDIAASGYHGLRIEMKAPAEYKSAIKDNQYEWSEKLNNQGYLSVFCNSAEEAKTLITDYLLEQLGERQ